MSDFEDEWVLADSSKKSIAAPRVQNGNSIGDIFPSGNGRDSEVHNLRRPNERRKTPQNVNINSNRPNLQPAKNSRRHGPTLGQPEAHQKHIEQRVLELPSAQKFRNDSDNPDGTHAMMHTYEDFLRSMQDSEKWSKSDTAKFKLAQMCLSTGAFIEVPQGNETSFRIWGEAEQVELAKNDLHAWEMHVKPPGRKEERSWQKSYALDGRKEYRDLLDQNRKNNYDMSQRSTVVGQPFRTYLVWPENYDFEAFMALYENGTLNEIRYQSQCQIEHDMRTRITIIAGRVENEVYKVLSRVITLQKEMVAQRRPGVKAKSCYYPTTDAYMDKIQLGTVVLPGNVTINVPRLTGLPLPSSESQQWSDWRAKKSKHTRAVFKAHIKSCIGHLQVSEKHVRMRVSFGELGLQSYRKPKAGLNHYPLLDFIKMVESEEVIVMQQPLLTTTNKIDDFVQKMISSGCLGEPTYTWTTAFDFRGQQGTTLRLEIEFDSMPVGDEDEIQRTSVRWLNKHQNQTRDVQELLELNAFDFEHLGFQIHIGATAFFNNDKVSHDLARFENQVKFRAPEKGLTYTPNKRSNFPMGQRELNGVREITHARYRFKNTEGILELRRIDTFPQNPGTISAQPASTEVTAQYYYHGWDRLMAHFANNEPGEDVKWERALATFFPRKTDPDNTNNLPQGFKNFMNEIDEIRTMLTNALSEHNLME